MQGSRAPSIGPGDWEKLARTVRELDDYACCRCGIHDRDCKRSLDVHHIIEDGPNAPANLVSLCRGCHLSIRDVPPEDLDFPLPVRCLEA